MSEKNLFPAELRVILVPPHRRWQQQPLVQGAFAAVGSLHFAKRNAVCCAGLYRACFMRHCSWCSAFLPVRLRKSRRCCGLLC